MTGDEKSGIERSKFVKVESFNYQRQCYLVRENQEYKDKATITVT
jgi:hypothetical protein